MDDELRGELTRIYERVEKVETNLLSAFRHQSTTMELRLKGVPLIEQRLTVMEDRVSKVECKLLESGL